MLIGVEITLRQSLGLGSPALLLADRQTGYRFKPNQKIFRFGKRIEYNQYSQRSEPTTEFKPTKTLRILMVGDSVLNGGNPTDQADILTEKLERQMDTAETRAVEVLNASAGSWGIGNQVGYLEKFGFFDSDVTVLQIGSHDLVQPTSTSEVVGQSSHPNKKPLLATQELIFRYLWSRAIQNLKPKKTPEKMAAEIPETQDSERQFYENMTILSDAKSDIDVQQIPVFVLFTPSRQDLIPDLSEPQHKTDFLETLRKLEIPVIDVHQAWSKLPKETVNSYFRDKVHLNPIGNEAVAKLISQELCSSSLSNVCENMN
ncbi:MAG: SGNH/GDSL hydrolase family protein [Cyanobacteria bacterium P01_H01_bin.21]